MPQQANFANFDPYSQQNYVQPNGPGMTNNPNVTRFGQPPLQKNQVLAYAWEQLTPQQKKTWPTLSEMQRQQWVNKTLQQYLASMGMVGHTQPSQTWGYAGQQQQQPTVRVNPQMPSPGWPGGHQPQQMQNAGMYPGIVSPTSGNPAAYMQMRPPQYGQR